MPVTDVPDLPVYGFRPDLGGVLGAIIMVGLPILVGLLTTRKVSPVAQGVLLLALAAVKVVLEAWLQSINTHVPFEFAPILYTVLINFIIAVAVHFGLYKPSTNSGASVANWAANNGVKSSNTDVDSNPADRSF